MADSNDIVKTEEEIDLVDLISKLWLNRKFIIITTAIFICIGVMVALLSPIVYTAGCSIVPQTNERSNSGNLSGLAAMAGVNIPSSSSGELLSPKVYPRILSSNLFYKELMGTEILFSSYPEPVKILDYFTLEEYNKESVIDLTLKYTIGLPFLIIKSLKGDSGEELLLPDTGAVVLSKEEYICKKVLSEKIGITLNEKEGYVSLSASMGDPLAAAQLTLKVQELLQKYVTVFKIEKVKSTLSYINSSYDVAKSDFEKIQKERADFIDSNRGLSTVKSRIQEERLTNEYHLRYNLYSELAVQMEQAKIKVTEATPVFTIIEPVTIPIEKSAPKRAFICMAFLFLGLISSMGWVLVKPVLTEIVSNIKNKSE